MSDWISGEAEEPSNTLDDFLKAQKRASEAKIHKRRWITLALWVVCLCPTWGAVFVNPATFWQTFTVSCVQVLVGLFAIALTIVFYLEDL